MSRGGSRVVRRLAVSADREDHPDRPRFNCAIECLQKGHRRSDRAGPKRWDAESNGFEAVASRLDGTCLRAVKDFDWTRGWKWRGHGPQGLGRWEEEFYLFRLIRLVLPLSPAWPHVHRTCIRRLRIPFATCGYGGVARVTRGQERPRIHQARRGLVRANRSRIVRTKDLPSISFPSYRWETETPSRSTALGRRSACPRNGVPLRVTFPGPDISPPAPSKTARWDRSLPRRFGQPSMGGCAARSPSAAPPTVSPPHDGVFSKARRGGGRQPSRCRTSVLDPLRHVSGRWFRREDMSPRVHREGRMDMTRGGCR